MRRFLVGFVLLASACGDDEKAPGGPDAAPLPPDGPPVVVPGDPTQGAWVDSFALPGPSGFGSRVEDVAIAGDGSVHAAGIFEDAAGVPVRNVARWTGTDWAPLAGGVDGWVRGLELDADGTLWAGVTSDDVSSATLQKWDGTGWTVTTTLDGAIRAIGVLESPAGHIAVVGDFPGSVGVLDPATDTFTALAAADITGAASAIEVTSDGYCVAGQFESIDGVPAENAACWDGSEWTPLGSGLPGGVAVLERSPTGAWFAGGTLTFVVDPTTGEYEAGIGTLVGTTWQPFEGGIDNGFINEVRAIAFQGDDVLVGGHFQTAGTTDVQASHLARWSPTAGWSEVSGGLQNDVGLFLPYIIGTADLELAADGTLWVGGLFTRAGGVPAVNLARFPATGSPSALVGPHTVLGVGGFVDTVAAAPGGGVIAGGQIAFGGQTPLANLGVLRDDAWTELGGVPGIVRDVLVLEDGTIAVAGELFIDGDWCAYAEWDGAAWQLPGGRVTGRAFAIVHDAEGGIWIGGELGMAGTATVTSLARLFHATWTSGGAFDGRITSLAVQGDTLIAGGLFTTVDGTPAAAIAIRDAAGTWAELGGGVDVDFDYVTSLAVSPALGLVVGGDFAGVGGVAGTVDLARWDGSAWHALAADFAVDDYTFVSAIYPYGDGVFISGGFGAVGTAVGTSNVAWFDGTTWHALGTGLADLAEELVVVDDVLYIGGPFTAAGGRPASGLAAWDFRD